jgi:zinc protease
MHRSVRVLSLIAGAALAVAAAAPGALAQSNARGNAPAASAPARIDLERLRIAHEVFTLDNGLTVIVAPDHSVPLVAVNLWYHVGSKNEVRGRTGFAHLFEHFFFNGSEHYPHGFREAMDDLGANNRNGTTNGDRTNFFEDVPLSGLERTLYLEADRMGWLAANINEAMLERERGVVKNEKRQGENQPYGRSYTRMVEVLYPYSHPYSWSTIGSMADLDAAKIDDVKQWYASYYGPNNAVLSLAGDITVARAKELVSKYFGAIPPGPPMARPTAWVPELGENIRDTMEDRVPQVRITRAWHLPPVRDPATPALELFASVLSGSESAPLDRRLVFDSKLATSTAAFVDTQELSSTLYVQVDVKPDADPAAAEREMEAVVAKLLADGPTPAELERAKTRLLSDFARNLERLGGFGGRSDVLAESMTYHGDSNAYFARLQRLQAATPAAVRDAARAWLSKPHYTLSVTPYPALRATADALDRSILPALTAPPAVEFPAVQTATLPNGLKLVLMERHSAPLVAATLAVDAGTSADPATAPGTGNFVMDLLLKGTTTRDTFALADRRDALGATLSVGNGSDLSQVRLKALKANLGESLALLADVARNPAFPTDMVEIQRKQQLAAIEQQQASPTGAAQRVLPTLVYGPGHAYAAPGGGLGRAAPVAAVTRADLAAWHARWFQPNNATLIVAGDVTMPELAALVERSFGDWRRGTAPTKQLAATASPGRGKVHLIDKPGAPQSVIVAAHLGASGATPQDLALETVMRNFGGMATSRMNRNLRLDKHWSYGTSGSVSTVRGPRLFSVVAPVQTDKTKEAMVEVLKEIRGVAGERPLQGEEYDSIMRSQLARLPGRFETLDALVAAATDFAGIGRAPAYYANYATDVAALTPAQLAEAGTFVRPDELTWLVIGDLAKIEAGVRELGYGEVVRIQAQ